MKEPILYRGTNMEVSMPTGSLCAERNVIGTALSANPRLKREDLKMIAVLAVPYAPTIPDSITGAGMKRINSTASFTSAGRRISIGSEHEEWVASSSSIMPPHAPPLLSSQRQSREDLASSFAMVGLNDVIIDSSREHGQSTAAAAAAAVEANNRQQQQQHPDNSLSSTPVRKISLFSKSTSLPDSMSARRDSNCIDNNNNKASKKKSSSSPSQQQQQQQQHDRHGEQQQQQPLLVHHQNHQYMRQQYDKRTVVIHNPSTDMNPLAPCGACNEWLKKIAESNPYFRIVTFTDADCNGVYCRNCQE
jgi:cytidine deaminase